MGHALNPDSEDRGDADLSRWIQASALQMDNIAEFQPLAGEALKRLRAAGLDFYALSIYLFDSPTTALHYAFAKGEVSWLQLDVTEEMAECKVYTDKEAHSWQTTQSDRDRVVAYLSVPTTTGVATIAAERVDLFAPVDRVLFAKMALALETLVVRHRDMVAYQVVNEAYLQVRSRLITGNPDLMALHDGSFDLSGETAEEVARRILEFIVQHLELDRGGIFLREDAELRGFWGIDEKGQPEQISQTVFPLYPERDEELTHTALIARGEEQYYLTQDLAAEGGPDPGANVAVPMRVGERIIGVLVADNFMSKRSIPFEQVQALMVLANQGAAALERAKLYQDLHEFNEELEQRVGERTAKLARANSQLQMEIVGRKQVEEALQTSLGEKDMLFREVHHRVKNNLQTISSLLSLQADSLADPQALSALDACRSRVEAMGRIHQQLYQSEDWTQVDFDQCLRELVEDLFATYRLGAVELDVDSEPVHCDVDQAIHCCLLINELVTNALKHAFPAGGPGRVRVGMKMLSDGQVMLEVADDGVGFSAELDFRQTDSLGMQIAVSLVKNLGGQIEMSNAGGTTFKIVFSPLSS